MKFNENIIYNFLKKNNLDKAREYMASCIPDSLSKFYSFTDNMELNENKLDCLANDCNWFENSIKQNDPFDMRMGFVDEAYAKKVSMPRDIVDFEKQTLKGLVERMLLCSFVDSDYRNLPMWAYYANNYQGYCVNYKINRKEVFFKVIYQNDKIRLNEVFLAHMSLYLLENKGTNIQMGKNIQIGMDILTYLVLMTFSIKHSSWQHENEYRILFPSYDVVGRRVDNETTGLKVNDITIGLNCKPEYKERIMQIAKGKTIKCYQLCADGNKFLSRQLIDL